MLASIGSVGDAYDNAMAESFVDTLKTELVADRVFATRRQLEHALVEWVSWYNLKRLHGSIGHVPARRVRAGAPRPLRPRKPARRMTRGSHQTQSP